MNQIAALHLITGTLNMVVAWYLINSKSKYTTKSFFIYANIFFGTINLVHGLFKLLKQIF